MRPTSEKRSLEDEIPKKKKFQRVDVNNNHGDEKNGPWVDEKPESRGQKVGPSVFAAVTCDYPHDVGCDLTCTLWNNQLREKLGHYPEDMKICFTTFDDTYGNCNLHRTKFENASLSNPDLARSKKARDGLKMTLLNIQKPEQMLPDGSNKKLTSLEQKSLDMLVEQCYRNPNICSSKAAFVSEVPFVCEVYRSPLINLTQEQFYKRVVATFEAHPQRDLLYWKSTTAIRDASLPTILCRCYP